MHSLSYRRVLADLVFCFRVLRKEVNLRASKYWVVWSAQLQNQIASSARWMRMVILITVADVHAIQTKSHALHKLRDWGCVSAA
ncbi:hypothetical protein Y032_0224g2713 [Ancylostoma ceylanicum]|uniref:Uncharacterized protein n=1 Tax=Ancylostoma ceylanicum TaxID=53326 RepID=A0A016SHF0_9BILA|nr:hypothetical protein Y032_0224g2713 [Ancylostoma ceylanicum]